MSMKLYVRAKSKKDLNQQIAEGKSVYGENFSFFGDGGTYKLDDRLPSGTVIAIYERTVGSNPVAKSYGTWQKGKVA